MAFGLKQIRELENFSKVLKKMINPEYYKPLDTKINGIQNIDVYGNEFLPSFFRWSFELIYQFCREHGVFSALQQNTKTKELLFDFGWKNAVMLEELLNILVDHQILGKKDQEYRPIAISERTGVTTSKFAEYSLRSTDTQWIEQSPQYQPIFTFYKKLYSSYVEQTMITGQPAAMLKGLEHSPLTPIYDSLLNTPAYITPRMTAIAAGITTQNPKTILDLNCSTGRGIEEILLMQPDAEFILGVDSTPQQIEIAKHNIAITAVTNNIREETVSLQTIDYSRPLADQLEEFSGMFDMVLINEFPTWTPKETHLQLSQDLRSLMRSNGTITIYQPFRPDPAQPWPHEWILRVLDGFNGYPNTAEFLKGIGKNVQTIIPNLTYLLTLDSR